MRLKLKEKLRELQGQIIIASGIAGLAIAANFAGLFQLLEWATLDQFFRLRPQEAVDERVVIVAISESDINRVQQWPIPDLTLADLLEKIKQQQPRVIGLDLYRDLPVVPGDRKLAEVMKSTPYLIGVEKVIGETVGAATILKESDRVGMADLVLDADGKVRRGLISAKLPDGTTKLSLGAKLALIYLEKENITLEKIENTGCLWRCAGGRILGKAVFVPFTSWDGGYVRADSGGYQILLNHRGGISSFETVSMTEVLSGKIPPDLMRDRIVLIGSTAQSLNDFFYTPYSNNFGGIPYRIPGVVIHANLVSQILSAAIDGRAMIKVWDEPIEWSWIFLWAIVGASVGSISQETNLNQTTVFSLSSWIFKCVILPGGILIAICYIAFLKGWWIVLVSPLFAMSASAIVTASHFNQGRQRLAFTDGLTEIANRRFFDEYLYKQWRQSIKDRKYLSLILCDVDFFKVYNDTYGHQAGDECLRKVARAIESAIRSTDLAARYGGEEFVVILPGTTPETAIQIAERVRMQVKASQIPHTNSKASEYVSLSCGIASAIAVGGGTPLDLIAAADKALYEAKKEGRDRVVLAK